VLAAGHSAIVDAVFADAGERAAIAEEFWLRELVAALVVPYAAHLSRPDGRDYLRIIAQLSARFSTWRDAAPGTRWPLAACSCRCCSTSL